MEIAQIALKKYFGYDAFRPMQAEIIQTVFQLRRDALVIMPTGGGKSICFQIPAVLSEGVAIVVSPLISLMKDQVEALRQNGIRAAYFNSSLTPYEQQKVEEQLFTGKLKLLYVSPEKMVSMGFVSVLKHKNIPISLFAIDEAHCISSWGHDFRPEYAQMGFIKQEFPKIPVIALTATADKLTRKDIVDKLALPDPAVFIGSFDRPNLSLEVRVGQNRLKQIVDFIKSHPNQSGIIYCLSRKSTESISEQLKAKGIQAEAYHAMLPMETRSKVQEYFLRDKLQIVVATVAFGMGIDKSNVRWVLHYNLPKNIESYYQEIGRGGRDGAPAETILFYSLADVNTYHAMLEDVSSENKAVQLSKLDRMLKFADAAICRRKILLNYFNEHLDTNCGNCDICHNPPRYFDGTKPAQMALSAVFRLKESVGMTTLTEVLKGSARADILENGYNTIKTYGAGRMYSYAEWSSYLWQLIQLGFLEIAYDEKNVLKLTPQSREVLFSGRTVDLVQPISAKEREAARARQEALKNTQPLRVRNSLYEVLRELRTQIASERKVAPYLIFSDNSLAEMAAAVPRTENQFLQISGVGDQKLQEYGDVFLKEIKNFLSNNPNFVPTEESIPKPPLPTTPPPSRSFSAKVEKIIVNDNVAPVPVAPPKPSKPLHHPKITTQQQTLILHRQGLSVDEISEQRFLSTTTIYSHLIQAYELGDDLDIEEFISKSKLIQITQALPMFSQPLKLREIFEYFSEKVSYDEIRWAIAYAQKQNN
jgi:ATP-dependent DNA helicase RecQ